MILPDFLKRNLYLDLMLHENSNGGINLLSPFFPKMVQTSNTQTTKCIILWTVIACNVLLAK